MRGLNRYFLQGLVAVALLAAAGNRALAQAQAVQGQLLHPDGVAPAFEVASVKQNHNRANLFSFNLQPSRFKAEAAPLNRLIKFAWDVKSDQQVVGLPDWVRGEDFDIDAKVSDAEVEALKNLTAEQRFAQYRLMVQALLEDRFQMKVKMENRELPVYALVVAKGGPKMTAIPDAQSRSFPQMNFTSAGDLKAGSVSMSFFAGWLSGKPDTGGRVVVDATGLNGIYDFALNWDPVGSNAAAGTAYGNQPAGAQNTEKPPMVSALQEQLGLKLEPRKAPVEVLVIESIEQPSPD